MPDINPDLSRRHLLRLGLVTRRRRRAAALGRPGHGRTRRHRSRGTAARGRPRPDRRQDARQHRFHVPGPAPVHPRPGPRRGHLRPADTGQQPVRPERHRPGPGGQLRVRAHLLRAVRRPRQLPGPGTPAHRAVQPRQPGQPARPGREHRPELRVVPVRPVLGVRRRPGHQPAAVRGRQAALPAAGTQPERGPGPAPQPRRHRHPRRAPQRREPDHRPGPRRVPASSTTPSPTRCTPSFAGHLRHCPPLLPVDRHPPVPAAHLRRRRGIRAARRDDPVAVQAGATRTPPWSPPRCRWPRTGSATRW